MRRCASLQSGCPALELSENLGHLGPALRLIGAVLLEANDEWQLQHRYMGVEAMGEILTPPLSHEVPQLPPRAA